MSLQPPPFSTVFSSRRRSFKSPDAATVCATPPQPPRRWKPRVRNQKRNQPTSRRGKDEFFALCLGLRKHPNKKARTGSYSDPGRMLLLQSKGGPGAQVALLQSLVSPTARADHHKV